MILRRDQITAPGTPEFDLFQGQFTDNPQDWYGYLPPLDYDKWSRIDPALDIAFANLGAPSIGDARRPPKSVNPDIMEAMRGSYYAAFAQAMNGIKASRNVIGQVSITTGMMLNQLPKMKNLFRGSLATSVTDKLVVAGKTLDTISAVLENPILAGALDGLAAVPIVGWIVNAAKFVATLVGKIIQIQKNKHQREWDRIKASRNLLPMVRWPPEADDMVMKTFLSRIRRYDATWVCLPRYPAQAASDFVARAAGPVQPDGRIEPLAAWIIYGRGGYVDPNPTEFEGEIEHGLGFVPGTTAIHGPMQLLTGFAKQGFDLGGYFPTAGQASATWWGNLLTETPSLYSVRADKVFSAWESYLLSLLEYAQLFLDYSWSVSNEPKWGDTVPSQNPIAKSFVDPMHNGGSWPILEMDPYSPDVDRHIPGVCQRLNRVARQTGGPQAPCGDGSIPTHAGVIFKRLDDLFEWSKARKRKKGNIANDVVFEDTTCGRAIVSLQNRQEEALDSMLCCYVDTSAVIQNGVRVPRFPALYHSSKMKRIWSDTRRAILNSDVWKGVELESVPGGDNDPFLDDLDSDDREFYRALKRKGAKPGAADLFGKGPGVFLKLRAPQAPIVVSTNSNVGKSISELEGTAKPSSRSNWLLPAAAAAAGAILVFRNPRAMRAAKAKGHAPLVATAAAGGVALLALRRPSRSIQAPKGKTKKKG